MKKRFLFLCFALCCLSIAVAQNAHFYLKDGVRLTLDVLVVDSITYLKPEAEVLLPTSCTLEAGTDAKFTYMVSDGLQYSPIEWSSTDSRIAYFFEDRLYARKAGKCIIYATYKGVTSSCVVTVMPSATINLRQLVSYAPLASYASAEIGVYMSQALTTGENSATGAYPYSQGWDFLAFSNPFWNWYSTELVPMAQQVFYHAGYSYNPINGQYEVVWNGSSGTHEYPQCNAILIARTILLMSTMLATDIYGDIPLAELGCTRTPKYETQQEVYDWMFKEVDELLHHYQDPRWVNCSTNMEIDYAIDPIYGGDLTRWEAFCKGLKARLWLRKLPNWDNTPAVCQTIICLVDDVLANWTEPRYNYSGGTLEDICPWGPYAPSVGGLSANRLASSIPTTFFLHGILGSIDGQYQLTRGYALDPRASKIMEPRDYYKGMLHLESNIGMDINNVINDYPDLLTQNRQTNPYTTNTGYIPLMTTEELLFIKAEAQYWSGQINEAYETTRQATILNMERYGIVEYTLSGDGLNQYKRFFAIKLPGADKFTIADLMQQKYVAMYLQPEQWTDMRRYNYSSSENGIAYAHSEKTAVYVYDVKNVHNGRNALFKDDAANFCLQYSLHRPYNLYEAYWLTPDDFGVNAKLSPNAWVTRILHTPNMFNISELYRMGYYTENANGDKVLDYRMLKKRMIWAQKNTKVVSCADENIEWQ